MTTLRSRLCAGAALVTGLGMAGVAAAAPAQAAIASDLQYRCELTNEGLESTFEDPWDVNLSVDAPDQVEPGATIESPEIVATVVPGEDAAARLRSLNVETLEGTSTAAYSFGDQERQVDLTIPVSEVPAEGDITNVATGTGQTETAPAEDALVDIVAGDFTADLTTDTGFVLNIACTAPEDATVGTIAVGDAAPEPTEPEPTEPEPTEPEPTEPEPTEPAEEPTEEAPAEEPTEDAGQPEVPAVVQTDGLTPAAMTQGDHTSALALGGLALAGAGAGTVLVVRRRAAQH